MNRFHAQAYLHDSGSNEGSSHSSDVLSRAAIDVDPASEPTLGVQSTLATQKCAPEQRARITGGDRFIGAHIGITVAL